MVETIDIVQKCAKGVTDFTRKESGCLDSTGTQNKLSGQNDFWISGICDTGTVSNLRVTGKNRTRCEKIMQ